MSRRDCNAASLVKQLEALANAHHRGVDSREHLQDASQAGDAILLRCPLGLLLGRVDFSNLFINLSSQHYQTLAEAKQAGAATLNYGLFINTIIDFVIVAFAIFLLVQQVNRLTRREKAVEAPTTKPCPYCATQIPLPATRCPNCTSSLAEVKGSVSS